MHRLSMLSTSVIVSLAGLGAASPVWATLPPAPAGVATFTQEGIEFSRVRAASVAAYAPTSGNVNHPIGGGSWDFGISRAEINQAQWVEFVNAYNALQIPTDQPWSSGIISLLRGDSWFAPGTGSVGVGPQGRLIYVTTPEGAQRPIADFGWLGAATYCNWLHNNRQVSITALTTGAYDLRSYSADNPVPTLREPDARYWIPSYDEWAVATYFDPNRFGASQAGWWPYTNRLDRLPIPGPPGEGETSAGWVPDSPSDNPLLLPSGAYPNSQSAWGLLDTSGTFRELIEDINPFGGRSSAGTRAGEYLFPKQAYYEQIGFLAADASFVSYRIATLTVPSPTTLILGAFCTICLSRRKRTQ